MRIFVTGSRYRPVPDVVNVLNHYDGAITELIVGDSTGADAAARSWALDHKIPTTIFETSANRHHDYMTFSNVVKNNPPDLCLAFPIDGSIGTLTCIEITRQLGVPVTIIPETNELTDRRHDDTMIHAVPTDFKVIRIAANQIMDKYVQAFEELSDK